MSKALIDDCFRPAERRLCHFEAIDLLRARIRPTAAVETVPLIELAGRIAAETVLSSIPVPAHTNAAVDGYAFASSAYDRHAGTSFPMVGRAAAGHPLGFEVSAGACCRILTGAVMPAGTDTVAMQEDVTVADGGAIHVPAGLKRGANVRAAGEDVGVGSVLVEQGRRIRPQDVAALASTGRTEALCRAPLRVAIVSTGDEVRTAGEAPLVPGEVYDANAPLLASLVPLSGARATMQGIWPDDPGLVRERLAAVARNYDVVLTSGGASRGDEDHLAAALAVAGSRHFWQLAIKPGRPMMLGQIGDTVVIGLPGNPVAVFVCYLMYVHPMLVTLGGGTWPEPRRWRLPAAFSFTGRKPGRREFWRGTIVSRDGTLVVEKFPRDGSGLISGLRAADSLIDIPEDHGDVVEGDLVEVIPFTEFGFGA